MSEQLRTAGERSLTDRTSTSPVLEADQDTAPSSTASQHDRNQRGKIKERYEGREREGNEGNPNSAHCNVSLTVVRRGSTKS